jgi:hypothetical protein
VRVKQFLVKYTFLYFHCSSKSRSRRLSVCPIVAMARRWCMSSCIPPARHNSKREGTRTAPYKSPQARESCGHRRRRSVTHNSLYRSETHCSRSPPGARDQRLSRAARPRKVKPLHVRDGASRHFCNGAHNLGLQGTWERTSGAGVQRRVRAAGAELSIARTITGEFRCVYFAHK